MYSNEKNLDIFEEAVAFQAYAQEQGYCEITFENALEIVRIRHLDMLTSRIDVLSQTINGEYKHY